MTYHSCQRNKLNLLLGLTGLMLCLGAPHCSVRAASGPVVITQQPTNLTVLHGTQAAFNVLADGTPPFLFQWLRDGAPIALATNDTYTLAVTSGTDDGAAFSVQVTNSLGNTLSSNAILRIDPGVIVTQSIRVVAFSNLWKYNVTGTNLGTAWRDVGYIDNTWSNGFGAFDGKTTGARGTMGGEIVRTPLPLTNNLNQKITTYYFRAHFNFTNTTAATVQFQAKTILDDGAIFYLNGKEMYPMFVNSGAIWSDFATRVVTDGAQEGPMDFPATNLVIGDNLVGVEVHQCNAGSSDVTFALQLDALVGYRVADTVAPVVVTQLPPAFSLVRELRQIEVFFSEPVEGVDAADLLIEGEAATSMTPYSSSQYVFQFPPAPTGTVHITWSLSHGIRDLAVTPNNFIPSSWTYIVDSNAIPASVIINEFMAKNTGSCRDEDGDPSDWIELYNTGAATVGLYGWALTDTLTNLTKWRFPNVFLAPNTYMLVWASDKNKTNVAGNLHTNFKLSDTGEYLGLVDNSGAIVSQFAPTYPVQYPDVSYGRDRLNPFITGYFLTPTTNAANSTSGAGFAPEVRYSRPSGTFLQPFTLELTTAATNAEIRYVLVTDAASAAVTNVPTQSSPLYTEPLSIVSSTQVRARAFQPGLLPGPPKNRTYLQINANVVNQSSDVPLVVIYNFGAGSIPATVDQPGFIAVFEPMHGRASLTNTPTVSGRIGFNRRGSSTEGMAKASFAVEFWDEYNQDKDVEVLGMPEESDWVFYAPNSFEPVLIHNAFAHGLSREIGRYSPRTRFVELYLNTSGGAISAPTPTSGNYNGVYLVEEKIKVADDRVDLDKLQAQHTNAPAITGGYLLKIDRADGDERTFNAGAADIVYQYPDGLEMVSTLRTAQATYIRNYFNTLYSALYGVNWTNPVTGYAAYADIESWIDHHWLNMVTFNVDALRLSGYFYKPRDQRINMGPLWDFDRALGSDDRAFNPRLWRSVDSDMGTDMFNPSGTFSNPWYSRMFNDIDFWQKYIDRYQELRRNKFSTNSLHQLVDSLVTPIREAQVREVARWPGFTTPRSGTRSAGTYSYAFPGSYQGEVDFLKKWLSDRVEFFDTNFLASPALSLEGGQVPYGFTLIIVPPTKPGSIVYYTLDGSDPRAWNSGALVASNAALYTGPILITNNIRLVARAFNPTHSNLTGPNRPPISSQWSGLVQATYVVALPPLRITELMYHPPAPAAGNTNDPDNFEYIELKNTGSAPLDLANFRMRSGIDFTFSSLVLTAGQYVVLVANSNAFQARYGAGIRIAGQYTNQLDNGGERLVLEGPLGETILDFEYDDDWYPITDGCGFSLVIRDENANVSTWGLPQSWRPSGQVNGSPGAADPLLPTFPLVVVNEVLTHTDLPSVDTVELFNAGGAAADIGGWWLTDNFGNPKKFRIPSPTSIPVGQFATFNENHFNAPGDPNGFAFSSLGEEVYLFSADTNGNLTGYVHGFDFSAAQNGVTFGRYVTSTGDEDYPAQISNTFPGANSGPRVGPVVISEVMYHPPDMILGGVDYDNDFDEFIELYNTSVSSMPLYDVLHPTNTWHLRDAVRYDFPTNVTLPPYGYLLVVGFDPSDATLLNVFRAWNGVSTNIPIFGPWEGKLANDKDSVELAKPDPPEPGFVPSILVDKVRYSDNPPWPLAADGMGASLQRINATSYGNDPINWLGAAKTPGAGYVPASGPAITQQPANVAAPLGGSPSFTVIASGTGPLRYQWRFNGNNLMNATNSTLALPNVRAEQAGQYQCVVMNAANSVASSIATLTVVNPPALLAGPQPQTAYGSTNIATYGMTFTNVSFASTVGGSLPLFYQWRWNGMNIPGATNGMHTITNASVQNAGNYTVLVTNLGGSVTSAPAAFTVLIGPVIVEQPQSTNTRSGLSASFTVRVRGTPAPFGYKWQRGGVTLTNMVILQTNSTLTIPSVTTNDTGTYTVTITNAANPVGVTSAGAVLAINQPPTILTNPTDRTVMLGSSATFTVVATGAEPLTYRWLYGPTYTPIPGATNPVLVITNAQLTNEGSYRVRVDNSSGATTSPAARLTVLFPPSFSEPQMLSSNAFKVFLNNKTNKSYRIEMSSNLSNWTTLSNFVSTNPVMTIIDGSATNASRRFYRANMTP